MVDDFGQALVYAVRLYGATLLAHCHDPHAELLALIWGPRFDRQQAQDLLSAMTGQHSDLWEAAMHAADIFDRLCMVEQHRLRRLIVRHQRQCHNFPCPEFS